MIHHTVFFRLRHPIGSQSERDFLTAALVLRAIPGVDKFEQVRQVSLKSNYTFGFLMTFANQASYRAYNEHPDHVHFVRERWHPEVADFLELDYESLADPSRAS